MALQRLGSSLYQALRKAVRAPLVDEKVVNELIRDLQRSLLQADVNVSLVLELSQRVKRRVLEEKVPPGVSRHELVVGVVHDELTRLLGGKARPLSIKRRKQNVFLLVGIQGSGKTTTAVKLAAYLHRRGVRSAVVCADPYRPGAFAQIKQLADRAGVPVYGDPKERSSVGLALRGLERFRGYEAVFIDTAGRHKDEAALMKEMRALVEEIGADEVILVIDATIGQTAMAQARAFHEATPIGSIFISKLDGTAKGGGALSAVAATGAPIRFIGVGEGVDDLEEFDPPRFVGRLLGLGDVRSLIERIKEARLEEAMTKSQVQEILTGRLTLETMYKQLTAVKRLGPLRRFLSMIPGLSYDVPEETLKAAEERLGRWKVIIQSMTPEERERPELIGSSRVRRIARGSGTTERDVRDLLRQYRKMKKLFKTLRRKRGMLRLLKGADVGLR